MKVAASAEVLKKLEDMVRSRHNRVTLIRRRSYRLTVYKFIDSKGTTFYFVYDRHRNRVREFLSEKEAIFTEGERVGVIVKNTLYTATIVSILAPNCDLNELRSKYANMGYAIDNIPTRHTHGMGFLLENNQRLYLYTIKRLRKLDEIPSTSTIVKKQSR